MTDKKPWELTKEEVTNVVEMDDVFGDFKTIERMAQKKMLEYLYSNSLLKHYIANFMTMECEKDCKSCQLIQEFGLDKNKR